jgi:hypothetical protein
MVEIFTYLLQHPTVLLILPVLVGVKQELYRGFTGRPSLVTNTATIFVTSAVKWSLIPGYVQLYAIIGLIVGIIGFFAYMFDVPLNILYYRYSWIFYNSVVALIFPFIF